MLEDVTVLKAVSLIEDMKRSYPRLNIVCRGTNRVPWHLRPLFWLLYKIIPNYEDFATTIGSTIYFDKSFYSSTSAEDQYCLLRHEFIHVKQFNCFPFGKKFWKLNYFIVGFLYVFILPCFFTMRGFFEREAYIETLKAEREVGIFVDGRRKFYINWLIDTMSGSSYFFMMTKPAAKKWATKVVDEVLND